MKILSIAGRNLNSLRVDFKVDFSTGVLKDCGIFAITGPTGAGKTTLLDAITLALYGRTPRAANEEDIISYGAGEAWAEVIFETLEGSFKSEWKARKARNRHDGAIQQSTMEVSTYPEGEILTQKKREALDKIKNLIKLEYDQFLKSVLLAQGAFKAFLDAKESERGDMLEKISDTSLYTRLSKRAFERKKKEEHLLNQLNDKAGNLLLLKEEERMAYAVEIEDLQQKEKVVQKETDELSKQLNWLKKIDELAQQLANAESEVAEAGKSLEAENTNLLRWEAHKQVAPLEPQWLQYQAKKAEGITQKQKLENLKLKISGLLQKLQAAEKLQALAHQQMEVAVKDREEKMPRITWAIKRKDDLQDEKKRLSVIEQQHKKKILDEAAHKENLSANNSQLKTDRQLLAGLEEWLAAHSRYSEAAESYAQAGLWANDLKRTRIDIQTHEQFIQKSVQQIADAKNQIIEADRNASKALADQQSLTTLQREASAKLGHLKALLQKQSEDNTAGLDEIILLSEGTKNELSRQQFLADHLSRLHEGEPCALCGSTDHPNQILSATDVEDQINQLGAILKKHLDAINTKRKYQKNIEKLLANLDDYAQAELSSNDELPKNFSDTISELLLTHRSGPQKLHEVLQIHASAKQLKEGLIINIAILENTNLDAGEKLQLARDQLASQVQQLKDLALQFDLRFDEKDPAALSATLKKFSNEYLDKSRQEAVLKGTIPRLQSNIESLGKQLLDINNDIDQLVKDVSNKKMLIENYEVEIKSAHSGYASPEEAQKNLVGTEKLANDELKKTNDQLNEFRQEHGTAQGEKQGLEINLKELADVVRVLSARLIDSLGASGLAGNLTIIEQNLLNGSDRVTLEKLHKSLNEKLRLATANQQNYSEQLATQKLLEISTETAESLSEKMLLLRGNQQEMNRELGRLSQILKEDDAKQLKIQSIKKEIEAQEAVLQKWASLSALIGSENGKKFNQFAQGLTLDRLLAISNHHLQLLNDRYLLKRKTTEQGLKLLIIDKYQADNEREINTLSGGESFLVSLALALGLSEMTSKLTTIDSLFIDEGFGTLDAETLEVALGALRGLQTNGKTIGIISHVERLKEEIYTQVEITKGADGFSTLKVIPELS